MRKKSKTDKADKPNLLFGFSVPTASYPATTDNKPITYWFAWRAGLINKNLRMGNVRI